MVKNFIFDLQRFKNISNSESNTLISGTSKADFISNSAEAEYDGDGDYYYKGSNVTIDAGKGNGPD